MSFPPQFFNREPNTILDLLTTRGKYEELNDAKVVTVSNEAALAFGTIGVDTNAALGFEYVTTGEEQFFIAVGLRYSGDSGAFQITAGDSTGTFATPIDLLTGETYWLAIPPDSSAAAPIGLTITALSADSGDPKTGTLAIIDRFNFSNGGAAVRTLKTLTLSKTGA